ncbi:MAG: tRNA 2-thiocytidine biosynthesis TtcA family protein [Fusobacteriaceae bacterium]
MINLLEISETMELHGLKFENYSLEVILDSKIMLKNIKDSIEIAIDYREKKRLKAFRSVEKILGTKIYPKKLYPHETLAFIESDGSFGKSLWSPIGKAMHDFKMIENGDRIAVGFSGGKDSMTVINALIRIKKISGLDFEIIPIHIHPAEDTSRTDKIQQYCDNMGLELQIIETSLGDMLFGEEKIKNPCFLCGRIRRGILYTTMKNQNINKLVLGHHKDDIIETFLMNSFYQGNQHMMKPSYQAEEYDIQVIRPLAYVEENDIIRYVKKIGLPILKSICPYETSTDSKRLKIKNLIKELADENPDVRSTIFHSIKDKLV